MIVKHVTAALRRQDWAAVLIEFVLVVLGVLFAFQINEWATEREARAEREAATDRLLVETENAVAYLRAGVVAQERLIRDLDYALTNIQRGTWRSANHERMTLGLQRMINAATPAPPSSVYDDLVASGTLGKIGDAKLRAAIADYRATLQFNGRYVDYFRQRMPDFEESDSLRYVFAPSDRRRLRLEADFAGLAQDEALQEKLALVADGHLQLLLTRKRTLETAKQSCIEIGRVAGRACNLNRPIPTF